MKIPLNPFEIYTSPKGRPFRLICVERIPDTEKWINRVEKSRWMSTIKMIDTNEFMELECDYNDNVIKIKKTV